MATAASITAVFSQATQLARSKPYTSLLQPMAPSLPHLQQPRCPSPGSTPGGRDTASLAGTSTRGQGRRAADHRSRGQSNWTHACKRPILLGEFLLRNPSQGLCSQCPGKPKGTGEPGGGSWAGLVPSWEQECSPFQKAFPDTSPGHLPSPPLHQLH